MTNIIGGEEDGDKTTGSGEAGDRTTSGGATGDRPTSDEGNGEKMSIIVDNTVLKRVEGKDGGGKVKRSLSESWKCAIACCAGVGICGTVLCLVIVSLVFGLALPIASIVIGALWKDECPVNYLIPIYLIVAGSVGLVMNLCGNGSRSRKRDENSTETTEKGSIGKIINGILGLFMLIWFIIGSVWVYSAYDQRHQCHQVVYWFAFITITTTYGFMALAVVIGCSVLFIFGCCAACKISKDERV